MATVVYVYMHALQLNYRANGQRAARHQDGAQRPRAALNYYYTILYYCRIQETPGAPEDTRGNKEGHQKDRRAQTTRTGGHSGESGETPRGPEGTTGKSEQAARPRRPQGPNTATYLHCGVRHRSDTTI